MKIAKTYFKIYQIKLNAVANMAITTFVHSSQEKRVEISSKFTKIWTLYFCHQILTKSALCLDEYSRKHTTLLDLK